MTDRNIINSKMQGGDFVDDVVKSLNNAGYQTIAIKGHEIMIGWKRLKPEDLERVKEKLESNGYIIKYKRLED